jgi:hypothetical protein
LAQKIALQEVVNTKKKYILNESLHVLKYIQILRYNTNQDLIFNNTNQICLCQQDKSGSKSGTEIWPRCPNNFHLE